MIANPVKKVVTSRLSVRWPNAVTGLMYLLPSILLFAVFMFYPMIKTLFLSLFITNAKGAPTTFVGLENYWYLFQDKTFHNSIKASLLFALYTVPTSVIISLFLALLANEKLKGIGFFRTIFSSTMGISVAASAVIWLFLFHPSIGFLNRVLMLAGIGQVPWLVDPQWALISVSITTVWMNIGFSFLILLGGLQNIDQTLYESARIDGAGYFYELRRITIPMLSPTLFFITTVTLINAFQSFGQIDILTKGGPSDATRLIVYSIYQDAFINYKFGLASAQAILLFFVVLIATILQFKIGEKKVHYQ